VLLLDASVWVASGAPADPYHAASRAIAGGRPVAVAALDLTLYEVANTVGLKFGQPRDARILIRVIVARCEGDRLLRVDSDLMDVAIEISRDHGISAYDAAYVAAARQNGWTLVSADIRDLVSKGLAVAPDAADYP
jgi:predicted nucleic acid-binding protein